VWRRRFRTEFVRPAQPIAQLIVHVGRNADLDHGGDFAMRDIDSDEA
jgi:hypothetical protein